MDLIALQLHGLTANSLRIVADEVKSTQVAGSQQNAPEPRRNGRPTQPAIFSDNWMKNS
jgi:hypothetical protein